MKRPSHEHHSLEVYPLGVPCKPFNSGGFCNCISAQSYVVANSDRNKYHSRLLRHSHNLHLLSGQNLRNDTEKTPTDALKSEVMGYQVLT